MRLRDDQTGTAAAEFAVAVPAALLVLLLAVGALGASSRQVRLEQAAAQAARLVARGESDDRARSAASRLVDGVRLTPRSEGDIACIDVTAPHGMPLPLPPLRATSCALTGFVP